MAGALVPLAALEGPEAWFFVVAVRVLIPLLVLLVVPAQGTTPIPSGTFLGPGADSVPIGAQGRQGGLRHWYSE